MGITETKYGLARTKYKTRKAVITGTKITGYYHRERAEFPHVRVEKCGVKQPGVFFVLIREPLSEADAKTLSPRVKYEECENFAVILR